MIQPAWPDTFTDLRYGMVSTVLRDALGHLEPGQAVSVQLPTASRHQRREGYLALLSFAHRVWVGSVRITVPVRGGDLAMVIRS